MGLFTTLDCRHLPCSQRCVAGVTFWHWCFCGHHIHDVLLSRSLSQFLLRCWHVMTLWQGLQFEKLRTCVDHVESSGEIREGQKLAVGDAQGHLHIQNIPKRLGSRAKLRCHRITSAVEDGNIWKPCQCVCLCWSCLCATYSTFKALFAMRWSTWWGRMRVTVFAEAGCSHWGIW